MKYLRTFGVFALTSVATFSSIGDVSAWETVVCPNGKLHEGIHGNITFFVNRCSIPGGSARETDLLYGMNEWNGIKGVLDRFLYTDGSPSCEVGTVGENGLHDVAFVTRSSIDGAAGVARVRYRTCAFGGGAFEADVFIASDLPLGNSGQLSTTLNARETIIHELGHVLGMEHEDDQMSVMCSSNTCGKMGEREASQGNGGNKADVVFPDDVEFAGQYHASSSDPKQDMFVSAHQYKAGGGGQLTHPSLTTYTRCPGEQVTLVFSHGNKGLAPIAFPNTYSTWIVMSTNTSASRLDVQADWFSTIGAVGAYYTNARTITVPNAPPGTYWLGVVVDPWDNYPNEDSEYNNTVIVNRKITIPSGC